MKIGTINKTSGIRSNSVLKRYPPLCFTSLEDCFRALSTVTLSSTATKYSAAIDFIAKIMNIRKNIGNAIIPSIKQLFINISLISFCGCILSQPARKKQQADGNIESTAMKTVRIKTTAPVKKLFIYRFGVVKK